MYLYPFVQTIFFFYVEPKKTQTAASLGVVHCLMMERWTFFYYHILLHPNCMFIHSDTLITCWLVAALLSPIVWRRFCTLPRTADGSCAKVKNCSVARRKKDVGWWWESVSVHIQWPRGAAPSQPFRNAAGCAEARPENLDLWLSAALLVTK